MHSDYDVFDCHCDSLTSTHIRRNNGHLKMRDIEKYRRYIQVFAICPENHSAYSFTKHYISVFHKMTRLCSMTEIRGKRDLSCSRGAILALEGADALCGNIASLKYFYNEGVRLITITWNNNNAAASSITALNDSGLTDFGKRLVKKCGEMGIAVDLSHIGDKGFYDVAEIIEKPFICSHSNSRSVNGKFKRNITDDQFSVIMKHGGAVGINFCVDFLGLEGDLSAVLRHIEHFSSLGGKKNIGIGSDFDGIPCLPRGCNGAEFISEIAEALLQLNYQECDVRDILYGNFKRVFKNILF